MSSDYITELEPSALVRYRGKLKICGLDDCDCQEMFGRIDQVDFGNIYVYLIDTPGNYASNENVTSGLLL